MIARISGNLVEAKESYLLVEVGGICYQVLAPPIVFKQCASLRPGDRVELVTYEFLELQQNRAIPVLIGFLGEGEREFFEHFLTVTGVGPKLALKAFSRPFGEIAAAIENGDLTYLQTLPGVGRQKAKEIVAQLQGKLGHLALGRGPVMAPANAELVSQAMEVLLSLQFRKAEAQEMIERALARNPEVESLEQLLPEVFARGTG